MKRFKSLLQTNLFRTVSQLYAVQAAAYVLPLLTVPYLARHIGAAGVGTVATFQALATYFTTLNEFGFNLSATRDAARIKSDKQGLSELLGTVIGAKVLLACICGALMLALSRLLPSLRHQNLFLASALLYTFGQSATAIWFYQATDRIAFATTSDLVGRTVGVSAIFFFVKTPSDAWLALAIPGCAILCSAVFCISVAYRELPFTFPSFSSILHMVRRCFAIFTSRCVSTMMNSGNALILSMFAPPVAVGYYSGAERIFRAGLTGLYPFSQVMFPRIAHLLTKDHERARAEVLKSLKVMLTAAVCLSLTLSVFGRLLVRILLGPAFLPSIAVLSVFAIVPVFRAITDVLGLQWMISHGLDRQYTVCLLIAGIGSTSLAFVLSKHWAQNGAVWAVVASEALLAAGILFCVATKGINPFVRMSKAPAPPLEMVASETA